MPGACYELQQPSFSRMERCAATARGLMVRLGAEPTPAAPRRGRGQRAPRSSEGSRWGGIQGNGRSYHLHLKMARGKETNWLDRLFLLLHSLPFYNDYYI